MKRKFQMRTLKRNNKITTLLVALAILILGIMIAYVCSKRSAMAADIIQCSSCGGTMSLFRSATEHGYTCSDCGYSFSDPHTFGYWTSTGTNQHSKTCSACGYTKTGTHTYDVTAENGTCTDCGYEHTDHTGEKHPEGKCEVCGKQYVTHTANEENVIEVHPVIGHPTIEDDYVHEITYSCSVQGCDGEVIYWQTHSYSSGTCKVCGWQHQNHTYSNGTCTTCGLAHTDHTYENGTCTVCEYAHTAHTYLGGTCTTCGLAHTDHTGGEHADGKCT
ncbi:MAG: hypothetical protein J6A29_01775, partial [Clostridia bacterium]|nr:hypothetical protein [Clostridia bacterium]